MRKTALHPSPDPATATTTQTLDIDGMRLHVAWQRGAEDRPPLLLLNGIGVNLHLFDPFVSALNAMADRAAAPRPSLLRVDAPGIGGSPMPPGAYRFSGLARRLDGLLDRLDLAQVDVLGLSWGGCLAQQFAHQHPQRCRRLILVATNMGMGSVPGPPWVTSLLLSPDLLLQPSRMTTWAPMLFGGAFRRRPELAHAFAKAILTTKVQGYYLQLAAGLGWTSACWLHRVRQPTLVLAGNDDPIVPTVNASMLANWLPHGRHVLFDGGHLFLVAQPGTAAPRVYDFLTEKQAAFNGQKV